MYLLTLISVCLASYFSLCLGLFFIYLAYEFYSNNNKISIHSLRQKYRSRSKFNPMTYLLNVFSSANCYGNKMRGELWKLYTLGASSLDPSRCLSRCALSVPFLRSFSVRSISLCAAYEPVVANLCVVCGHYSRSAGWTTASAAGRSASSQPACAGQVNRK